MSTAADHSGAAVVPLAYYVAGCPIDAVVLGLRLLAALIYLRDQFAKSQLSEQRTRLKVRVYARPLQIVNCLDLKTDGVVCRDLDSQQREAWDAKLEDHCLDLVALECRFLPVPGVFCGLARRLALQGFEAPEAWNDRC